MSTLTMAGGADSRPGKGSSVRRRSQAQVSLLTAWIARRLRMWRSADSLEHLNDRLLRDIGFRRSGDFYAAHTDCE